MSDKLALLKKKNLFILLEMAHLCKLTEPHMKNVCLCKENIILAKLPWIVIISQNQNHCFHSFVLMTEPSPTEETPTTKEDHEMQLKAQEKAIELTLNFFFPSLRINF